MHRLGVRVLHARGARLTQHARQTTWPSTSAGWTPTITYIAHGVERSPRCGFERHPHVWYAERTTRLHNHHMQHVWGRHAPSLVIGSALSIPLPRALLFADLWRGHDRSNLCSRGTACIVRNSRYKARIPFLDGTRAFFERHMEESLPQTCHGGTTHIVRAIQHLSKVA